MRAKIRAGLVGSLVAAVAAIAVAACGSQNEITDASSGAQIFTQAGCGSCHTLASAHATGNPGPNLDTLKPEVSDVESQVTAGDDVMPAYQGRLSPAQIHAVSVYVYQTTHPPGARQ